MKKHILFLISLVFSIGSTFAECAMSGMQFFPEQKEISLNSMFIIQGYSISQRTINSFNNRTVYLESENGELVVLSLQELLKGQMELTQAIFCPSTELKPNTVYFLKYSNQTDIESNAMMQYNSEIRKKEKVYWKTTNEKYVALLNPNIKIEFEKTETVMYGCGPSANAVFNIKNKVASEIWYKTEVVNLTTKEITYFYIKEWNGKLSVGHGMCSGAFVFGNKGEYKVRFTPMNIDGKSIKTTDWITFKSPFMNDKNPLGF